MDNKALLKALAERLEFLPAEGYPNASIIHFKAQPCQSEIEEMTEEDWDRFEADIADAFERVP